MMTNPLTRSMVPHDAQAAVADSVALIAELVERVEKLEAKNGQS